MGEASSLGRGVENAKFIPVHETAFQMRPGFDYRIAAMPDAGANVPRLRCGATGLRKPSTIRLSPSPAVLPPCTDRPLPSSWKWFDNIDL